MSLHDVQAWMQAAISEPARSDLAARGDLAARAGEHLQSTPALDAHARLGIYQRSYRARLLQSFQAIFPGLLHALGRDMLDAFALDFLARHPPHHPSINRLADGFAEHLRCTRPASSSELENESDWADFVVDLARLETLLLEVSEARGQEDMPAPDAAALREMSAAQLLSLRPSAAPCLRLASCRFPVHAYLQALRAGDLPEMPRPRPVWLALTRVDYRLSTRELAPVQWELLRRLDGKTTVGDALRDVAALNLRPAPSEALARIWLANFLAQGLLDLRSCITLSLAMPASRRDDECEWDYEQRERKGHYDKQV